MLDHDIEVYSLDPLTCATRHFSVDRNIVWRLSQGLQEKRHLSVLLWTGRPHVTTQRNNLFLFFFFWKKERSIELPKFCNNISSQQLGYKFPLKLLKTFFVSLAFVYKDDQIRSPSVIVSIKPTRLCHDSQGHQYVLSSESRATLPWQSRAPACAQ